VPRSRRQADLADPNAEPSAAFLEPVDACLRCVALALLGGADDAAAASLMDALPSGSLGVDGTPPPLAEGWEAYKDEDGRPYYWNDETGEATYSPPTRQLDACLAYLRDRIGVPRDMSYAAAMALRAHLNWAIGQLRA